MSASTAARTFDSLRHAISQDRPRLLGSRQQLQALAKSRPEAFKRMLAEARKPLPEGEGHVYEINARIIGLAIAYVLEGDAKEARTAVDLVLREFIDQPLEVGHVTFAHSMAKCAIVYDLCHDLWTGDERQRFQKYVHATIAANVDSEPSVFHNGWYGYKHWGYGMAAYALMHDDPETPRILENLERDYLKLAAPGLQIAGEGGGWAEGYYIHYWELEWLFFCEVARWCEGVDYLAAAPEFYSKRAIACMFENYPPIEQPRSAPQLGRLPAVAAQGISRRFIPMGDGHGQYTKHERDKSLTARRILVNYHRDDPAHQAVHAFNLQTPRVAISSDAYMDFLWDDQTVKTGDLDKFALSHVSPGAGFVFARSSWKDDATYLFFRSGRRFTAHQHMDNGTIMLFKNRELLGDGGHYDWFGGENGNHAINYYMRTIAHSSILIHDPAETWPQPTPTSRGMRAGPAAYNDGGQAYPWIRPGLGANGGASDLDKWHQYKEFFDIGAMTAFREGGDYVYAAGDYTRSYSSAKAKCVTRQIVYLRPGTVVVFDRVESTNPSFRKTMLLQAMKIPEKRGPHWIVTHGTGRLFIQTLAPAGAAVKLYHGDHLYEYDGRQFPPDVLPDAAAECRMEISPSAPATMDCFLHVLTTADASVESVPAATAKLDGRQWQLSLGEATIRFDIDQCAGSITRGKQTDALSPGGAEAHFK